MENFKWLQTTLSDLDEKMKVMMTLVEEEDISSCPKREMSHNRKQLVRMLGELNRSFRSLVHNYDQLRSKPEYAPQSGSSSLSSKSDSREIQEVINKKSDLEASDDSIWEASDSHPDSVVDDPEYLNKLADDLILAERCNMSKPELVNIEFPNEDDVVLNINEFQSFKPKAEEFPKGSSEKENTCFQLKFQFTKLMEENLRQQAELLRRNEEKRETINELRLQIKHLESVIKTQEKCLHCSKVGVKRNHSQTSRSTGLGKFFRGDCS